MQKKTVTRRILLWTAVMFVLIGVLLAGLSATGIAKFENSSRQNETVALDAYAPSSEASAPASGIRNVEIEWISGSVTIELHDGSDYEFYETSTRKLEDQHRMYYRVHDGTLSIQFHQPGWSWGINTAGSKALTLRVPASAALQKLDVECVSSGLTVDGVQVNTLRVETVSGSVDVCEATAQALSLAAVSGSAKVSGAFDEIDVESVSGSLAFALAKTPDTLDAETTSGSITVQTPGERGFTARMDSLSGSLSSNFAEQTGKRELRYGDGDAELEFETISGSVQVNRLKDSATPTVMPTRTPPAESTESEAPFPAGGRGF